MAFLGGGSALAMMQTNISGSEHDMHLLMIAAMIIAVAMGMQAVGFLIAASFGAKLLHKIDGMTNNFEAKLTPVLEKTNALVTELGPKVHAITTNVEQVSYTVREKVDELAVTVGELNRTVKDLNVRTHGQVVRVDGMVTEALVATHEVSRTVQDSIKAPVKQIAGVVAGARAALETLIARSPFGKRSEPGPYDL